MALDECERDFGEPAEIARQESRVMNQLKAGCAMRLLARAMSASMC